MARPCRVFPRRSSACMTSAGAGLGGVPRTTKLPQDVGEGLQPPIGAAVLDQQVRLEVDVIEAIVSEQSAAESRLRLGEAEAVFGVALGDEPGKPVAQNAHAIEPDQRRFVWKVGNRRVVAVGVWGEGVEVP